MNIGIVTGASSGIGEEFVLQLQHDDGIDEMWMVARREKELAEIAAKLKHLKGVPIPINLTASDNMDRLKKKIEDESPQIKYLVNNAGYGRVGTFEEAPAEDHLDMIDLNVKALVELTHMCIPHMVQGSVIFQLSSISAFLPSPNMAVYAATKAFVLHFSYALYQGLKAKGIHVISVSPGPVDTEFWDVASEELPPMAARASNVVKSAIKDAKAKKINSTYGFAPKANILLSKVLKRKTLLKLLSK